MYLLLFMMLCSSSSLFSQVEWNKVEEIEKNIVPPIFPDVNYIITDLAQKMKKGLIVALQ